MALVFVSTGPFPAPVLGIEVCSTGPFIESNADSIDVIEVTDEMAEAGLEALHGIDLDGGSPIEAWLEYVRAAYRAMAALDPRFESDGEHW